jgi:uncharacterized phage infection (PIP) family protein YhgE
MNSALQLIMEQPNKLSAGQKKMSVGQDELKTVSTELKSDIIAVSSGQEKLSSELKTDILAVEDKISATQEQLKNDLQDEISAIKEDLRSELSDLRAGQTELEERVADKLDKQLKGVTSMVEQQRWNLREDLEAT